MRPDVIRAALKPQYRKPCQRVIPDRALQVKGRAEILGKSGSDEKGVGNGHAG